YFGIVADITPPVALAAFAATGISGGAPIRTGVNASKLAIAAFIIPYMFVLEPALLLIDTSFIEIKFILITAIMGMIAIGAGMIGYWYTELNIISRIIAVVTGLLLIYPGTYTDLIGVTIFVIMLFMQYLKTWIVKLSETLKRHVMIYSIYNLPKLRRVYQTCPTHILPKQS